MPNPRGRPQKHTHAVTLRLPLTLISELKTRRPELVKTDGSGHFAPGKLSKLVGNLLWKEVRKA